MQGSFQEPYKMHFTTVCTDGQKAEALIYQLQLHVTAPEIISRKFRWHMHKCWQVAIAILCKDIREAQCSKGER